MPARTRRCPPSSRPDRRELSAGLDPRRTDALVAAAEAAADVAGAVIRPFFAAPGSPPKTKRDSSPVTIADRSAEQAMRAVLAERFPEHGILGEEFGLDRPEARLRWVLDPIDGTRAFITGRPLFGTLIGLLDGETSGSRADRPARHRRALDRRCRAAGPVSAAVSAEPSGCRPCATLADAELSCTSPGHARACTARAGSGCAAAVAAHVLGRGLLCLWPARAGADRRDRRSRPEDLGLGGAAAGRRGSRRAAHRLVRPAVAPRTATAVSWRWAIRRCCAQAVALLANDRSRRDGGGRDGGCVVLTLPVTPISVRR